MCLSTWLRMLRAKRPVCRTYGERECVRFVLSRVEGIENTRKDQGVCFKNAFPAPKDQSYHFTESLAKTC